MHRGRARGDKIIFGKHVRLNEVEGLIGRVITELYTLKIVKG